MELQIPHSVLREAINMETNRRGRISDFFHQNLREEHQNC
jgi:hypothetical protein